MSDHHIFYLNCKLHPVNKPFFDNASQKKVVMSLLDPHYLSIPGIANLYWGVYTPTSTGRIQMYRASGYRLHDRNFLEHYLDRFLRYPLPIQKWNRREETRCEPNDALDQYLVYFLDSRNADESEPVAWHSLNGNYQSYIDPTKLTSLPILLSEYHFQQWLRNILRLKWNVPNAIGYKSLFLNVLKKFEGKVLWDTQKAEPEVMPHALLGPPHVHELAELHA